MATVPEILDLLSGTSVIGLDIETLGLNPRKDRIRLLSVSDGQRSLVLDCFEHPIAQVLPALSQKILIIHNATFDLAFLWHAGLKDLPETVCTYLLTRLLDAGHRRPMGYHGLAECCVRELGIVVDKSQRASNWAGPLSAAQLDYARRDASVLLPLYQKLGRKIVADGLLAVSDIEMRALPAFVWLRESGVQFDRGLWEKTLSETSQRCAGLVEKLNALAPVRGEPDLFGQTEPWNWDSPQQVEEVLHKLGFKVPSTGDAQLAKLNHPFAEALRQYRGEAQLIKMYGEGWLKSSSLEEGRIYPDWKQLGTETGRTTCNSPNLQQVPRAGPYRQCFTAAPGNVLVKCDYSTLQMRIAARIAGDQALLKVFLERGDTHTATAQMLLGKTEVSKGERQIAKSANFALIFGASAEGLRTYAKTTFGIDMSEDEARQHRARFFQGYSGLINWHQETRRKKVPETHSRLGRKRWLFPECPDTLRLNSPVQADEADLAKTAMALLWERRAQCPSAKPVLFNHDEICLDVDESAGEEAENWLRKAMLDGAEPILDPVPAAVESKIVKTWGD